MKNSIPCRTPESIGKRSRSSAARDAPEPMAELIEVAGKLQAPIVHACAAKNLLNTTTRLRRFDRPARIFLWLPRHDELRSLVDARKRTFHTGFLSKDATMVQIGRFA